MLSPEAHLGSTRTVAELSSEAAAARDKFVRLGFSLKGSRLLTYIRTLERFSGYHSHEIAKANATIEVADTLVEAADLIEIARLRDEYLRHPGVSERVVVALSGRDYRRDYELSEHDPTRNAAFELCTAAYLQQHGILGDPPTNRADVLIKDGACSIPAECKRVTSSSPRALKDNLRNARRQLVKRVRGGAAPGLIVVDLTRAINPHTQFFYYVSELAMRAECGKKLHAYITSNIRGIQHPDIERDEVLGIAMRLTIPAHVGISADARRYIEWTFVPIRSDDVGSALFESWIEKFGAQPLARIPRASTPLLPLLERLGVVRFRARELERIRDALYAIEIIRL